MVNRELLMLYLQRLWLYAELGILKLRAMWYASEIEYLDRRIAEVERELAEDGS